MPLPRPDKNWARNRVKVQSVSDVLGKYSHKGTRKCTKCSKHREFLPTGDRGQLQSPWQEGKERLREKLWLKIIQWSRWRIFWQIIILSLLWRIKFSSKRLSTTAYNVTKDPKAATRLNFWTVTKDTSATLFSPFRLLVLLLHQTSKVAIFTMTTYCFSVKNCQVILKTTAVESYQKLPRKLLNAHFPLNCQSYLSKR